MLICLFIDDEGLVDEFALFSAVLVYLGFCDSPAVIVISSAAG